MNRAGRLFTTPPNEIYEHPDALSTAAGEIAIGQVEGWWCYAPRQYGNPGEVIGPFIAEVRRDFQGTPVITVTESDFRTVDYYFHKAEEARGARWFQSGKTLRWIKAPL